MCFCASSPSCILVDLKISFTHSLTSLWQKRQRHEKTHWFWVTKKPQRKSKSSLWVLANEACLYSAQVLSFQVESLWIFESVITLSTYIWHIWNVIVICFVNSKQCTEILELCSSRTPQKMAIKSCTKRNRKNTFGRNYSQLNFPKQYIKHLGKIRYVVNNTSALLCIMLMVISYCTR